jgi:hypothetical protein
MKRTSKHHGYQVEILCIDGKDFLLNDGKVYKSEKVARNVANNFVEKWENGKVDCPNYTYYVVKEWFSDSGFQCLF